MERRSDLRRTGPPPRTTGLASVTPIRQRSAKRAREQRTRVATLRDRYGDRTVCERCRQSEAHDAHELLSRARGGSIIDVRNVVALCRPCHRWITEHPAEAEATGWSLPSGPGAA